MDYLHENGQKNSEVLTGVGKKMGKWTEWYTTGEKKSEGITRMEKDGKWTEWYKNGQKSEGNVHGWEKRWKWTYWELYDNGLKFKEELYMMGKEI
jgi:antitoxin component YwqK of YwqJK toxin-antitoxin module